MKYWFLKLRITNGEYESIDCSLHKGKTFNENDYASNYYDGLEEEGEGRYGNGEISVEVYGCEEISKKDYEILKKYI